MAVGDIRRPAVSGLFYEADASGLRAQVRRCFAHSPGPGRLPGPVWRRSVRALVVPHAALQYSGPVAAHAYLRLAEARPPAVIVVVGPDHLGSGSPVALSPHGRWATPLGAVETDHPVREELRRLGLPADGRGHLREHSIEVQLPFLQVIGFRGPVIPVVMADQETETVVRLADLLVAALAALDATMIASTDLSHYVPHERAVAIDRVVLAALVSGDGLRFLDEVRRRSITMCGAGPVAAVMEAARRRGGGPVEILRYATSGDTGGDRRSVVGYVAAAVDAS